MKLLLQLFKLDKTPRKGLLPVEWATVVYAVFTIVVMFLYYNRLVNPHSMIELRLHVFFTTAMLYLVYRLLPCRFTLMVRVVVQMSFLAWWYPDTYEMNRIFPNLDHIFATYEQQLFGSQPSLWFSQVCSNVVFSELMHLGYAAYYPLIGIVCFFFFFCRYEEFQRATFIVLAAFFLYYAVFVVLPVTGPTFYYQAVGVDEIARGVFPNLHDYFLTHQECLPTPGYTDGVFYHLVEKARQAGERPTAAFPSSHVGLTTILVLLAWHSKSKKMFYFTLPFLVLILFATVYIQAHYVIDSIAGLITGALLFAILLFATRKIKC